MGESITELRFHGRGGQGAKTAAQLLAEAALEEGKEIQTFPEYGPERTGAPMQVFARISDKKITTFAPVVNPDIVLVIDPTLIGPINVTVGLSNNGILIVNTNQTPNQIKELTKFNGQIYTVDATKISIELLGKNLPNMPILGALIKKREIVSMKAIENVLREHFEEKIGKEQTQRNVDAIKRAYDEVR